VRAAVALAAVGTVTLAGVVVAACTAGRSERARTLPSDRFAPLLYVALGDSTVEGVAATSPDRNYVSRLHERLRAVYPGARLENLGRGGAVSAGVVEAQLPRAVRLSPDLVTLSVGPNDLTEGVPVEAYAQSVNTILRTLVRETDAVVVVTLLPDLAITPRFRHSERRDDVARLTVRFNDVLARAAAANAVDVVDLYAASRREVPDRPELVAADGYHPSDVGYARWAELMWPRVEARIAAH
jgi:acyl-CoA thioesterase I